MNSYTDFAAYYDELMEDARYEERCRYILETAARLHHVTGRTLDLVCGTGSFTVLLAQNGVDVFGADGSADMLSVAVQKSLAAGQHTLFVQQDMRRLMLPEPIDTCVCTLDSLNHLTESADVQKTFQNVARYLRTGGLFIFDVNTVYKHREVLADNVFIMENEHVFCSWQNFLSENDTVDIVLDFFAERDGMYDRFSEAFSERAYSEAQLRQWLAQAGFDVPGVYGDLTFAPPGETEQRIIFCCRKK